MSKILREIRDSLTGIFTSGKKTALVELWRECCTFGGGLDLNTSPSKLKRLSKALLAFAESKQPSAERLEKLVRAICEKGFEPDDNGLVRTEFGPVTYLGFCEKTQWHYFKCVGTKTALLQRNQDGSEKIEQRWALAFLDQRGEINGLAASHSESELNEIVSGLKLSKSIKIKNQPAA